MPLSLVIFNNPTPYEAHPLLATHDPIIIAVVRRLLLERLGADDQQSGTCWRKALLEQEENGGHA